MEKHRKRPVRAEDPEAVKTRFIEGLSSGVPITKAAVAAGVSRSQVSNWRKDDEAFAKAWDDAWQAGADAIEEEMRRRGLEGWLEPVFYQGVRAGDIRKFSDTLLIVLHKIRRPEPHRAYQEHREPPGNPGGPAEIEDARKRLEEIFERKEKRRKELAGVPQPPHLSKPAAN